LSRVFVFPRGSFDVGMASGPFQIADRTPGLELVYTRNQQWAGPVPLLDELVVRFVQSIDIMLALLEQGRLDAASPPSSVNLQQRMRERGIRGAAALGSERVYLDLEGAALSGSQLDFVISAIDRAEIEEGFIRGDGSLDGNVRTSAGDSPGVGLDLAAPVGDELLILTQRVIQAQLKDAGLSVDLVTTDPRTFYSEWARSDPFDLALRRATGPPSVPGPGAFAQSEALRLFRVETMLAWRAGVHGLAVNPSGEGPLWNAEKWWAEPR
jgi:ABC-type transport system substrate-binding protein